MGAEAGELGGIDTEKWLCRVEEPCGGDPRAPLRRDEKRPQVMGLRLPTVADELLAAAVGIVAAIDDERHVGRVAPTGKMDGKRLVLRPAAFAGDADGHRSADVIRGAGPRLGVEPLHHETRRSIRDRRAQVGGWIPAAVVAKHIQVFARRLREPAGRFARNPIREPSRLVQMLVEIAAAEEIVVVAAVGAGEPFGRREPVGRDAGPEKPEHRLGLPADRMVVGVAGDQAEAVEIDAMVGRARVFGDAVAADVAEPLGPQFLPAAPGLRITQSPQGEMIPDLQQEDVRIARLHGISVECGGCVMVHRVEQIARRGREGLGVGQPEQARELGCEGDGIGIGDGIVAESPAVVAEVVAAGSGVLHRPRQPECLLNLLRLPAKTAGLECEPQDAANAERGRAGAEDRGLRLELADGIVAAGAGGHGGPCPADDADQPDAATDENGRHVHGRGAGGCNPMILTFPRRGCYTRRPPLGLYA